MLILQREYVAGFWPLDPHPPGSQLEDMYGKILKTEQESNKTEDTSQTVVSNGASASSTTAMKS
jgi:chromodomain-helicase-DNA-binding protein 1